MRIDLETDGPRFMTTFAHVWAGDVDNDGFNRLVLAADLDWREAMVLRTYARWFVQLGLPLSQTYMEEALASNAAAAGHLLKLFVARFDPGVPAPQRRRAETAQRRALDRMLARVTRIDDDRILRAFLAAIGATQRTNYFQVDAAGQPRPYLALKLDPRQLAEVPLPKPMFEIFVHSPRVEGVHLRMGAVARGGLRWSDRREDFRTEILGLMKAQNVKNTVIVPVGAKGGFVPRRLPLDRDEAQQDGTACYRTFIRALLDVTDNVVGGKVVAPPRVVRHDGDDAYLVVAADKGTAKFSDVANAISEEYGFWLGDAFASGGSAGYDHKEMGITARGGWESVRRHFRELGLDTQSQDFTVAGVGDMSGDVFGNAMLLSKHIRLLAAFDHRHIFIDPSPDAAASFAERRRMFALPRSSWEDYDLRRLSKGGGVHSRQQKAVPLSPEARTLLGIDLPAAAPNDVIRAILRLPVDLLWNGGIGTYVKSADETHAEIGDRANDAVRVNGAELRCRVVGEGGNLGVSQRGRIEYAIAGGRINTDFIDNSAGVNCSDVEVNLKILFNPLMATGKLSRKARNRLLESMTEEVAGLVLRNNYLQCLAISGLHETAAERIFELGHLLRSLERAGTLDRALEALPTDEEIVERHRKGQRLTRPELAMLLSYSKIWLSGRLMETDIAEDPYLGAELTRYFPKPVQRRYPREILRHQLSREIIVTATTNSLVNRMGPGVRDPHPGGHRCGRREHRPGVLDRARDHGHARPVGRHRGAGRQGPGAAPVRDVARDHAPAPPADLLGAAEPRHEPRHRTRGESAASRHSRADVRPAGADHGHRGRALPEEPRTLLGGWRARKRRPPCGWPGRDPLERRHRRGRPGTARPGRAGRAHLLRARRRDRARLDPRRRSNGSRSRATGRPWRAARCARKPTCCSADSPTRYWVAAAAATRRSTSMPGSGRAARPSRTCGRTVREMRTTGSADFPTLSVALQAVRQLAEG